ncbi:MAG: UDP-N-acetylmuramoyl-L-alanine--D-glutamate ligase [Candidatus Gracilibacteria bacterium]|nr:UDP-N-acetylmuramoyl-L-alanine--D-glutamate ligase [Candidatus Gracilibacteria bacterium]
MKITDLENKKIAILGFGKEGKSSLNFLLKNGILKENITILDKGEVSDNLGVNFISGENYADNLQDFDIIIKSPGLSPYNENLAPYRDKFTSQTQMFFDNYNGKVIGVTGSKGKSTTSTLVYEVLKKAGFSVKLVGNIGTPVLDEVDVMSGEKYDFIVYELSSYMLEVLKPKLFIGILNNVYDVHLDWHLGRENYTKAKFNLFYNCENKLVNYELFNRFEIENPIYFGTDGKYNFAGNKFFVQGNEIFDDKEIVLLGEHNKKNISSVIGVCDILGIDFNILKEVLKTFSGLSHRMEDIGTYMGITFIDDAMATTPESTIAAIKTFGNKIGTLFLGGQDSGFTFTELRQIIDENKIENIVLFPDTGIKIYPELEKQEDEKEIDFNGIKFFKTKSMEEAIKFSYKNTSKGKTCLMSNAAPSMSVWKNYLDKAEQFKKYIEKYSK